MSEWHPRLPRWALWTVLLIIAAAPVLGTPLPHVVYHINFDDRNHQVNALRNLQNQLDEAHGNIVLVVVLHGAGLSLLLDPDALPHVVAMKHANGDQEMAVRVDLLRDQGVHFLVAANSARRHHIDPLNDLHGVDPEDMVPNGPAELARLQQQGYIYVKP